MTQTSTTTQIDRRTEVGPTLPRCTRHYTDGPWYLVGEGLKSRAYCTVCNCWLQGVAAEFDPTHVAAYEAYITSPATVAKLKQIALDGAKVRIKFGPAGRRRIVAGATAGHYGW